MYGGPPARARRFAPYLNAEHLVPHRRPGHVRPRRLLPLRRPQEGFATPPRREHLVLWDGDGVPAARGGRGGRGSFCAVGRHGGRRQGDGGTAPRGAAERRGPWPAVGGPDDVV